MTRTRGADRDPHGVFRTPITASVLLAACLVWVLEPILLAADDRPCAGGVGQLWLQLGTILGSLGRQRGTATSPILGSAKPDAT